MEAKRRTGGAEPSSARYNGFSPSRTSKGRADGPGGDRGPGCPGLRTTVGLPRGGRCEGRLKKRKVGILVTVVPRCAVYC